MDENVTTRHLGPLFFFLQYREQSAARKEKLYSPGLEHDGDVMSEILI